MTKHRQHNSPLKHLQTGIDIVDISELQKKINSGHLYLTKILDPSESYQASMETIAGKVAAKEAIIKTGFIKPGDWLKIIVSSTPNGAPVVLDSMGSPISSLKITISHTTQLAIAFAIYEKT